MWVNQNSVPTSCAYGIHNKVVPYGSIKHLIKPLQKNHVPYDYIENECFLVIK